LRSEIISFGFKPVLYSRCAFR